MTLRLFWVLLLGATLILPGCGKKSGKAENFTVITAQPKSQITELHFSGTLGPLSAQPVISPFEGRVTHVLFVYGQQIQQGQAVVTLDASKLSEDYRKTVSDYLQKKQGY